MAGGKGGRLDGLGPLSSRGDLEGLEAVAQEARQMKTRADLAVGTEDLLPLMAYALVQAALPHVISELRYIEVRRTPDHAVSGPHRAATRRPTTANRRQPLTRGACHRSLRFMERTSI